MTDSSHSSLPRFEELLDIHGADLERWPEAERANARALLQAEPEARALHAQAMQLAAVLDAHEVAAPSAELQRRVAEIPLRHPHEANSGLQLPFWLGSFWRSAFAGALMAGLGVAAGLATGPADDGLEQAMTEGATLAVAGEPSEPGGAQATGAFDDGLDDESTDELDALLELAFVDDSAGLDDTEDGSAGVWP